MTDEPDTNSETYSESHRIGLGEITVFECGLTVEVNNAPDHPTVFLFGEDDESDAWPIQEGEVLCVGLTKTGLNVTMTLDDDTVEVTASGGSGADAFAQHMRYRGRLPEFNPPADGQRARILKPRHLDRDLTPEQAEDVCALLENSSESYAITFPESEAPETYIRATEDGFAAVRSDERKPDAWNERTPDRDGVLRRMRRERATRIVRRDNAPNALYPEYLHTDDEDDT